MTINTFVVRLHVHAGQPTDLKVALVGVEDDGFLLVVLAHHFHGESRDGGLEVGLLGIDHHSHVLLSTVLHTRTQ